MARARNFDRNFSRRFFRHDPALAHCECTTQRLATLQHELFEYGDAFYPELADGEVTQDGTRKASELFHSFGEVLGYNPKQAATRYFGNLASIFWSSWTGALVSIWLGLLGLLGAIFTFADRKTKPVRLLLVAMAAYFLLMGLNHWEARYFFFIGVCYAGLASYLINRFAELAREKKLLSIDSPFFRHGIAIVFLAVIWTVSMIPTKTSFGNFMQSHPHEIPAATQFLQSTNAAPHSLKILARKPHLPFMAKQDWVFFPPVKSPEELKAWLETNRVDYIAIGKRELKSRKELAPLGDPKSAPDWLQAAWTNDDPRYILYKPSLK